MVNYLKRVVENTKGSIVLFYAFMIIDIILCRWKWLSVVVVFFEISVYIFQAVSGYKKLKNGSLIELGENKIDFRKDREQHAQCVIFGVAAIFLGMFEISLLVENNVSEFITIMFFVIALFFCISYYSIKKDSMCLKCLTLFSSTAQGMTCILVVIALLFDFLGSVLYKINEGLEPMNVIVSSELLCQIVIVLTYYLERKIVWTLGMLAITVILYYVFIYITPIYQLEKLKKAFQIMNICMTMIGILAFFCAYDFCDYISNFRYVIAQEFIVEPEVYQYALSYGVTEFKNLFYIAVLPYTCGILLANMFMNIRIQKCEVKEKELLIEMMESKDFESEEKIRKYYAVGGNSLNLKIMKEIYDVAINEKIPKYSDEISGTMNVDG